MKKNIIFNLIAFIVLAFFISLSSYPYIHAETKAEAQNYSTTATVPSPVSVKKSTVDLNASEVLAEPESHSILLTVTLKDDEQKPISNRKVEVVSNRGIVDVIEAVSKISEFKVQAAESGTVSPLQFDETDKNGQTAFRITSFISGESILSITADSVVQLESVKIKFLPLPFPANLTIVIKSPFSNKEWSLISPQYQEEKLSAEQKEAKKLVNTGSKIHLPLWLFAILVFLLIGCPVFIILNFVNLRKLKKMEKQELNLLTSKTPPPK